MYDIYELYQKIYIIKRTILLIENIGENSKLKIKDKSSIKK